MSMSCSKALFSARGWMMPDARYCCCGAAGEWNSGDDQVFLYNRSNAAELIACARTLDGIVLEGHSTDYQSARSAGNAGGWHCDPEGRARADLCVPG